MMHCTPPEDLATVNMRREFDAVWVVPEIGLWTDRQTDRHIPKNTVITVLGAQRYTKKWW